MNKELGYYRGYKIFGDSDGVLVKKNGRTILSCENEREAYDSIDNMFHHDLTKSSSSKYCIKIKYPGVYREYFVGRNRVIPVTSATEKDVRLFNSKKEAEKVYYKNIKRSLSDHFYEVVKFK